MSKERNYNPRPQAQTSKPDPTPIPQIPDPTVQCGLVESVRLPTSDLVTQDKEINRRLKDGWEHYESLMVYGNEMILRFRK